MKGKDWRKQGYKTVFVNGRIYIFSAKFTGTEPIYTTLIDNGKWRDHDNLHVRPWTMLTYKNCEETTQAAINTSLLYCYCDQGVDICDYCAGTRKPGLYETLANPRVIDAMGALGPALAQVQAATRIQQILHDFSGIRLGHCREPNDEGIAYLLSDILHYCDANKLEFRNLLLMARHKHGKPAATKPTSANETLTNR